jgi:hypothetical protein
MATFLPDAKLWPEIQKRAKRTKTMTVVSAFLGTRPESLLKWPRKSMVVADLTEANVRRGVTSAKGALRLRSKNVAVLQYRNLHAKMFLFDDAAVVASSNLSLDSTTQLVEAGVLLAGTEAAPVRREVNRILRNAVLLDRDLLRAWARVEPKRSGRLTTKRKGAKVSRPSPLLDGRTVWLLDTYHYEPDSAEQRAQRRTGKLLADDNGIKAARIDWFGRCGRRLHSRVQEGDWIVFWWREGRRTEHGRLEGPYECIAPVDLGKGLGRGRFALAVVPRSARGVGVEARQFTRMSRAMSARELARDERALKDRGVNVVAQILGAC